MRLCRRLPLGALLVTLLAAPPARADLVSWSYNWSTTTPFVQAAGDPTAGIKVGAAGAGGLVQGNSSLVAASLSAVSSASPGTPSTIANAGYSLTLTITDKASGKQGSLTFTGVFNGTLSSAGVNISNAFASPLSRSVTLGSDSYVVTVGPFVPPGPPGAPVYGSIGASVVASLGSGTGGTTGGPQAPEPSSLLLAGLGLVGAAGARWRGRRAGRTETV